MACPSTPAFIKGCDYAQFLVTQTPIFDKQILADIRPGDGWPGHVQIGTFDAFSGSEHTLDRFKHVFPDITYQWDDVSDQGCDGTPCDPKERCLGWGASRVHYGLEQQSWATNLLCFDQLMLLTKAKQHVAQITTDILKPATVNIFSNFIRKRAFTVGTLKHWVANATMSDFTGTFTAVGDREIYFDTTVAPTSKLTPQMLQRRVPELMRYGYMGKNPYKDSAPFIELVTDLETAWELDKLATSGGTPGVANNWRFTQWDAANEYWRYGFSGQLGNYAIRVDPMQLRFNYVGQVGALFRYQVILPYTNVATSGAGGDAGLGSIPNTDWDNAQYALSFIWHKMAMEIQVLGNASIGGGTTFNERNFRGLWQFVTHDLGEDCNGVAINNTRGNKGKFIADFKLAAKPMYTELAEAIFHKREPACIITVDTCANDPGYPEQSTGSCNCVCPPPCDNAAAEGITSCA